jgi:hypothetical protein
MLRMKTIPSLVMLALLAPAALAHTGPDANSNGSAAATAEGANAVNAKDGKRSSKTADSKTLEAVVVTGQAVSFTNSRWRVRQR